MKNIALTGGGTGGHTYPLLAIYNYLKKDQGLKFIWFGEENGLENTVADEYNIPFVYVPSGKIRRYFDIRNFYEPLKNISGMFFSLFYILKYKIDIIISKGGFVSLPLCLAGFILRKPIYIHESDTIGGLANNIISKLATKVFYTFPNDIIDDEKYVLTGQIINPELFVGLDQNIEENEKLEVLVIAGSQGSTIIFENLISILNNLIDINFTIILGDKNIHFKEKFEQFNNVTCYDFVSQSDLKQIYTKTDIALTRGGATTLWELYYFGIHSIIIPLSNSAQNHQFYNAEFFRNEFQSDILDENNQLNLSIFRTLNKYTNLRKSGLNTAGYKYTLQKIKSNIM